MKWHIETRKVSELKSYEHNPRVLTKKGLSDLKKSIDKFGLAEPIVINTDNVIIGGHARTKVLLPTQEVDVYVPDKELTEEEYKELNVRLNKNIAGEWDFDILANHFDLKDLFDWGFDEQDLKFDLPVEEDDAPEVDLINEPTCKLGEIYQLGEHRLMCGDSCGDDVVKLMNGKVANMVFTDPPYNVDYKGGSAAEANKKERKKIDNDKMKAEEFYNFLSKVCNNLMKHTVGAFYICMSSSELHNLWKAFTDAGGHWQTYIVWAKHAFTLSRSDYQHKFEPILYGLTEEEAAKINSEDGDVDTMPILYGWNKHFWYGGRKQGDVWMFDKPSNSKLHPTMKPIALCAKAIRNSSKPGEIVLDLFSGSGSGSTLIACEQIGRVNYAMELDPRYCDVIIKRWEQFTGSKAIKL